MHVGTRPVCNKSMDLTAVPSLMDYICTISANDSPNQKSNMGQKVATATAWPMLFLFFLTHQSLLVKSLLL